MTVVGGNREFVGLVENGLVWFNFVEFGWAEFVLVNLGILHV